MVNNAQVRVFFSLKVGGSHKYYVLAFSTHWDLALEHVADAFTYSAGEL